MRYRNFTKPHQSLGQVFTPSALARKLVGGLGGTGGSWLELGVGSGKLLEACMQYGMPEQYVGAEIDETLIGTLASAQQRLVIHHADVLDPLALTNAIGQQQFDFTIGNPPFGLGRLPNAAVARLDTLCPGLTNETWTRLDLYFMLESLARLKRPGAAAFIVGSPVINHPSMIGFRKSLIESAAEIECISLPLNTFRNAEVQSYLLQIKLATKPTSCTVKIGRYTGNEFDLDKSIVISKTEAIERMDLSHYEFAELNAALKTKSGKTLRDTGASIIRGSRSKSEFYQLGIQSFHTTDFPTDGKSIAFTNESATGFLLAEEGHILVPRVGTRCLNRQAMVSEGRRPFTEAVFRIDVPKAFRNDVFKWISSEEGIQWRINAANGSCAKYLTIKTLLDMPLPM